MEPNPSQNTQAVNTCVNCGGLLTYDLKNNSNKCAYCGSAFEIAKPDGADKALPSADCIPFKLGLEDFKTAVLGFLSTGNTVPVNLLLEVEFLPAQQLYVPFYHFKGNYDGFYDVLDIGGKVIKRNTPLSGQINTVAYGGKSTLIEENIAEFTSHIDTSQAIPVSSIGKGKIKFKNSLSAKAAWETFGLSKQAGQIYKDLARDKPGAKFQHHLTYNADSATTLYYPVWRVTYLWKGDEYDIYMDGVSGKLSAGKPEDHAINPPTKSATYRKYLLIGSGLWFSLLIIRAALAATIGGIFDNKTGEVNNILFSTPAGFYWLCRGFIFIGVFPLLMVPVFYNSIVNRYYARFNNLRNKNIALIASGKRDIKFLQDED